MFFGTGTGGARELDGGLYALYREYNGKWFATELPVPYRLVWETEFNEEQAAGTWFTNYEGEGPRVHIRMNPVRLKACAPWCVELVLLHEMVHVKLAKRRGWTHLDGWKDDVHGPKFQAEMLRLARAGAMRELW